MKLIRSLILALAASSAHADHYVIDAFGILPSHDLSVERARWAGLSENEGTHRFAAAQRLDTVLFFVGPKSLAAGQERGHAVAIGLDRYGNLAVDGLAAQFRLGDRTVSGGVTADGLADLLFDPGTVSGDFIAGASIADQQSGRRIYRVTADIGSASVAPAVAANPAEPEVFVPVASAPLIDQFGNTLEDGIGGVTLLQHPDGQTTMLTPVVRDGRAQSTLLTRDIPSRANVVVGIGPHVSAPAPLRVSTTRLAGGTPVQVSPVAEIDAIRVHVGPVTTSARHLLNDGAKVRIDAVDLYGRSATADGWLLNGEIDRVLHLSPEHGPFDVTVTTDFGTVEGRVGLTLARNPVVSRGDP